MMKIKMLKEVQGEENTALQLYKNNGYPEKPYTVRLIDLDVNETIYCVICPNIEIAEKHFKKMA